MLQASVIILCLETKKTPSVFTIYHFLPIPFLACHICFYYYNWCCYGLFFTSLCSAIVFFEYSVKGVHAEGQHEKLLTDNNLDQVQTRVSEAVRFRVDLTIHAENVYFLMRTVTLEKCLLWTLDYRRSNSIHYSSLSPYCLFLPGHWYYARFDWVQQYSLNQDPWAIGGL